MIWLIVLWQVLIGQTLDLPAPAGWADPQSFGVAEQREAPILIAGDEWLISIWMSADDLDTYHTLRRWDQNGLGAENRLPILTAFPQKHQIIPSLSGLYHLLWLDGEPSEPLAGLRLWGVMMDQSPDATRGAFITNDYPIYDFDAVMDEQGGAWVFFNSLPLSEPNLYVQHLDWQGRPRPPEHLMRGVEHPRAVRLADGTIRLFWHNPLTDDLMSGVFVEGQLTDVRAHFSVPAIGKTDVLEELHVAFDQTTFYIFWNIRRLSDGQIETFFASASHADLTDWTLPQPLLINGLQGIWASPMAQSGMGVSTPEKLFVAGVIDNEIGIISFQAGSVIDVENVIALGESRLVGGLYLTTTPDGRLALSWSHLSPTGAIMSVIRQEN